MKCPICAVEMELVGEGGLDQCGDTHLRARRWTCPRCPETVHLEPVSGAWEPGAPPVATPRTLTRTAG